MERDRRPHARVALAREHDGQRAQARPVGQEVQHRAHEVRCVDERVEVAHREFGRTRGLVVRAGDHTVREAGAARVDVEHVRERHRPELGSGAIFAPPVLAASSVNGPVLPPSKIAVDAPGPPLCITISGL